MKLLLGVEPEARSPLHVITFPKQKVIALFLFAIGCGAIFLGEKYVMFQAIYWKASISLSPVTLFGKVINVVVDMCGYVMIPNLNQY